MDAAPIRSSDKIATNAPLKLDSAALQRLMEEVRNNAVTATSAYNRVHNRHNR